MPTSPHSSQPEGASLESCCSASSAHGTAHTEAQRLGLLPCLATSNFQHYPGDGGSLPGSFHSPAPKMQTSPHSSQPEGASLESCCSASSAHGTAHTEAQRLGLLACLATANFKGTPGIGGPCRARPASLLQKCERLQIARSQKGLAWKAVAQIHLLMALLALRHRDWGCLLVLPPQTSNASRRWETLPGSFHSPALKMRMSPDSWQPEEANLESCFSASSAHGTACTEAQRLGVLVCLATSNFKRSAGMNSRTETSISPVRECKSL